MIYYFQRLWLFRKVAFSRKEDYDLKCQEYRALREYRRARWAFAGRALMNHLTVYLRYNRGYGHAVIGLYILTHMILGIAILLLILSLISLGG